MNSTLNIVSATAMKAIQVLGAALALSLICLPAFPQAELGRITGSVSDQTGSVIPGATVTVIDTQRGESRTLTTDGAGAYFASSLLPGTYTVRTEFKGFKTMERQNVALETGQEIRVDSVLQAGDSVEKITVVEALPLINLSDAVLGGTISNATINDLPLNGRDYQSLLTIRPGIFQYAGGGSWTQSTNGVRPDANGWLLDGQLNADPGNGRSVVGVQSPLTDAATLLPIDAIQEFNTQVSPKAETGWKTGATVNVGIKSGTNDLHGTAYAFGRDGSWDARNYFNPVPDPQIPLSLVQWGASVGGPIKKDKLFYFGAFETYNNELGVPQSINAPETISTGDVKHSIPDATAALQAKGIPISAVSQNLLKLYPDNPTNSTLVNTAFSNQNTSYNGIGKINYRINDRHSISGFLFWSQYEGIGEDRVYVNPAFLEHVPIRSVANSYNWIYTRSATIVNEARFGFNRSTQGTFNGDLGVPVSKYGLNTGVTDPGVGGLPTINITGGASFLGSWTGTPGFRGPNPFYRWADQVSYFRGKHAFKFGGEFARAETNVAGKGGERGSITFTGGQAFAGSSALEDFLAGKPTRGQLPFGSDPARTLRRWQYAGFGQDDWRATQRLTLNLGLRYEHSQPPREINNLIGNFDPSLGLVQQGKQISSVYNPSRVQFSPRLGLAWDVTGKGTTVLRAGFSIMYETVNMDYLTAGLTTLPTGALLNGTPGPGTIARTTVTYPASQLNWPLQPGATATVFPVGSGTAASCTTSKPCNAFGIDPNFKTPYITNWTVGIQHAFTNNLSLEVAYVGNHGSNLLGILNINAPPVGAGFCANSPLIAAQVAAGCVPGSPVTDPTAVSTDFERAAQPFHTKFPYLNYVTRTTNLDRSNYNGLQATLTKRLSHGLSITAGYTYSHALDSSSLNAFYFLPVNSASGSRASEYASSDFDMRHRLTIAFNYALPGKKSPGQLLEGWQINGIVTLQSPQPWTVLDTSNDLSGTGNNGFTNSGVTMGDRWNYYGNFADFKPGTTNGIPFFDGASNPKCLSQAKAMGPGAVASLNAFGCFAQGNSILIPPAPGTLGTLGRNTFRDLGFKNVNASIYKNWTFKERYGIQFRAEFFNVFNHPNFNNPYGGVSGYGSGAYDDPSTGNANQFGCGCATPDVGAGNPVIGSGSMRAIQLGLKLRF
jgi:hypothetical protein